MVKKVMTAVWEFFFGRIHYQDARETYLEIIEEINDLTSNFKKRSPDWRLKKRNYERLKQRNLNLLLPETIRERTNSFFERESDYHKLRKESDLTVDKFFKDKDNKFKKGGTSWVYSILLKEDASIKDLDFDMNNNEFNQLLEQLNNVKEIMQFVNFIKNSIKDGEKLSRDLIKEYKRDTLTPERRKTALTFITILLTLVLAGATIFTAYKSSELIERQIDSLSLLKPEIEVSLSFPKDRKIAVWDIAYIGHYIDGNQYFNTQRVRFILSNIGRMRSGAINARLESPFTSFADGYVEDIVGESSEYLEFSIRYKKCSITPLSENLGNGTKIERKIVDPKCDYKVTDIPLGWQEFNFTIECSRCLEEYEEKKYHFDFCIYDETENSRKVCDLPKT